MPPQNVGRLRFAFRGERNSAVKITKSTQDFSSTHFPLARPELQDSASYGAPVIPYLAERLLRNLTRQNPSRLVSFSARRKYDTSCIQPSVDAQCHRPLLVAAPSEYPTCLCFPPNLFPMSSQILPLRLILPPSVLLFLGHSAERKLPARRLLHHPRGLHPSSRNNCTSNALIKKSANSKFSTCS